MTTAQTIAAILAGQDLPKPSAQWLSALIASQRPTTPANAIAATAKVRLLSSDIMQPGLLDASATVALPLDLSNPAVKELKLTGTVLVQVLGIEDLSRSRWQQIEDIEAFERGECTRGREVVRVVASEEGDNGQPLLPPVTGGGPHKLILQDVKGQAIYGLELKPVPKVGLGMGIGSKLMIRGAIVARGIVLLEPATVTVLGGKIEPLHKIWRKNRKKDLKEAIAANREYS